jgi:Zinc finger, C2H2 type
MRKHMDYNHELKQIIRFPCSQCTQTFRTKQSAQRHEDRIHLKIINEKRSFPCDMCDKVLTTSYSLINHKQLKHESGHFPCTKCDETFEFKPRLTNHILTEHSEKIACEICGFMCAPGPFFSHHMTNHKTKACPYEGCDKVLSLNLFKNHIESAHMSLRLQCPTCPSVFGTHHNLKIHIRCHHKKEPIRCKVAGCDYSAKDKRYLMEHYQRHSGISEEWRQRLMHHLKTSYNINNSYNLSTPE